MVTLEIFQKHLFKAWGNCDECMVSVCQSILYLYNSFNCQWAQVKVHPRQVTSLPWHKKIDAYFILMAAFVL